MTFEEAKKILEMEGFKLKGPGKPGVVSGTFIEYESPEVCEAMQVASSAGFRLAMLAGAFDERKTRLKKEYEKCTKAPGPGEEEPKEDDLKAATKMFGAQAREIMRLTAENAELRETIDKMKEGNPALKESASQFNDALLDEQAKKIEKQAKKIEKLAKENERLKNQIAVLDACKKHNDKINQKQIKGLGKEIAKLNGIIHDKNEELKRKTKGCCELITENVDLKKKLSDKDAILADVAEELRLSKIREKNLTELCQKYIKANEELKEKLADKVVDKIDAQALKSAESALAYKEKVISDLQEKLKSIKKNRHNERVYKKKLVEKDEVIADLGKELAEAKKLNTEKMLDFNAMCLRAARESINDVFESYAAKYAKSTLDELKEKAYDSFNAKAHNLGLAGSKDGNGIIDQIVGVDIAEELSKVTDETFDQFLQFGVIITKEEK